MSTFSTMLRVFRIITGIGMADYTPKSQTEAAVRMKTAAERLKNVSEDFLAQLAVAEPNFDNVHKGGNHRG